MSDIILKPNGDVANPAADVQEIKFETPVEAFIFNFYSILNPALRAVLAAGIEVKAVLKQSPDGTLSGVISPSEDIARIDHENRVVYRRARPSEANLVAQTPPEPNVEWVDAPKIKDIPAPFQTPVVCGPGFPVPDGCGGTPIEAVPDFTTDAT